MKRICLLGMVLLLSAALCACQPETQPPETTDGLEIPTAPPVQVEMDRYTLTYAGELKDKISYEELPETEQLRFYVSLSTGKLPIFTLQWGVAEGELVTMVDGKDGEKIPVSFSMEKVPETLSKEDYDLFCTAQEQVNAIVTSLKIK